MNELVLLMPMNRFNFSRISPSIGSPHAAAMGAHAVKARDIADLEAQILAAKDQAIPTVIVIETDPMHGPGENGGGHWWDVAVPEVSDRAEVNKAREGYGQPRARFGLLRDPRL